MNEMPTTISRRTAPQALPTPAVSNANRPLWTALLGTLCLVFLLCVPSQAQVSGGSITGTVTDPSGAVVPGATVKIVNRGTGITQVLTTTSTGLFNKPNLDPGTYDVIFEANGFRTMQTDVLVDVGHDTVLEMKLQVATAATEIVTVTT